MITDKDSSWDAEMVVVMSIVTKAISTGHQQGLTKDAALLAAQIAIFNYMNVEGMSMKIESVLKEAMKVAIETHKQLTNLRA